MDILEESFGKENEQEEFALEDLVEVKPTPTTPVPEASVRNRAATVALLTSEPEQMVDKYRLMMQEAAEGNEVTREQAMQSLQERNRSKSMKHVIGILGDSSIPLSQKESLMNFIKKNEFKEDPSVTLQSEALVAESKGEDLRGEAARISTADVMREMQEERENRQKLINGFMSSLPDKSTAGMVADIAAAEVMPFGRNKIAADISEQIRKDQGIPTSFGSWVKDFLLPGSTKREKQEKLNSIPPSKREAYTKLVLGGIGKTGGVFHNDNYYSQFTTAVQVLESPMMSDGSVWAENMMTVLDAFWVGSEVRAAKVGIAGSKMASDFAGRAGKAATPAQKTAGESYLDGVIARNAAPAPADKSAAATQKRISQLEAERASLLGDAGNPAAKGDVARMKDELQALQKPDTSPQAISELAKSLQSNKKLKFKDAEKEATKQIQDQGLEYQSRVDRLTRQIDNNRSSSVASQRLDAIDSEINTLKKTAVPSPGLKKPLQDAMDRIRLNAVVRRENPAAPYSIIEQANPTQARALHQAMIQGSDELAEAVTGVNREQALANNTFPQVGTESGAVLNKVNQDVKDILNNTGATRYTANEFEQASSVVMRDFRNATGLEINDAMTTFRISGDKVAIDAHYSTAGGAFTTAEGAKAQAEFALRKYGIRDDEIVVMKRQGMDYVPVEGGEGAGDYIIKVKTLMPVSDEAIASWTPFDVKRNWTDRVSQLGSENKGNLSGWAMDPGSMLHPTLTGSMSIAVDQAVNIENVLLKPIKELRTELGSFKADRQRKIEEYWIEANTHGIKHDPFTLTARGFTQPEIAAMAKWKDIWDGHFYLENFDLVKTLNSQGFEIFQNATTKLFAKPLLQKNQNIARAYDPSKDAVVSLSKAEMDSLYDLGGHYATLRRPLDINGKMVEHMIVRNTPTEYLRKLRDTDEVLNYREGYYTINYKAPKFIDEIDVDALGKEIGRRTVAVAGNTKDADMFINSQQAASGKKYQMREDTKGFKKDGDGYWDVNEARGRIAQRLRGQPLTQATGVNTLGAGSFIENPLESAVRAAKSLAGRTITRPALETAKKRFVEQYGDLLKADERGQKVFPTTRNAIVDTGSHTSSRAADARTTYGYINFMEDGYINSADEVFKGGMNVLADMLGKYHLSGAERAARVIGDTSLTNLAKGTVFQAYIAMSNPIRQWIVQTHQVGRMAAYNPQGFLNGGFAQRMGGFLSEAAGLSGGSKLSKDFYKFANDSGMVSGVDRNSLVRGLGLSMADSSSTIKRGFGKVASLPQTVGFDLGEKANQLGHLAAVHEKWTRRGIDLATDLTARDLALTEARALSYDLNKAGEFAYTQSTPAMVLQFLQMPHKALAQAFNRKLPWDVRARLQMWDLVMWGAPVGLISAAVTAAGGDGGDILPEDEKYREMFVDGVQSWAYNEILTQMDDSGERTGVDFSALAPNNQDGWIKMYTAMLDDGVFGAFAASPAGQLIAIDGVNESRRNGRIPQAIITMGRYMNQHVFEQDTMTPVELKDVADDVFRITSGWSAAANAKILLETRKKANAMGGVVDSSITNPEIGAAFLGLGTKSTKELYEISKRGSAEKKAHEEEIMSQYRDIMTYLNRTKDSEGDIKHIQRVNSLLMSTFQDPTDLKLVMSQYKKDLAGPEIEFAKKMLDRAGMPNNDRFEDDIKMSPLSDRDKDLYLQRMRDIRSSRAKYKDEGN